MDDERAADDLLAKRPPPLAHPLDLPLAVLRRGDRQLHHVEDGDVRLPALEVEVSLVEVRLIVRVRGLARVVDEEQRPARVVVDEACAHAPPILAIGLARRRAVRAGEENATDALGRLVQAALVQARERPAHPRLHVRHGHVGRGQGQDVEDGAQGQPDEGRVDDERAADDLLAHGPLLSPHPLQLALALSRRGQRQPPHVQDADVQFPTLEIGRTPPQILLEVRVRHLGREMGDEQRPERVVEDDSRAHDASWRPS